MGVVVTMPLLGYKRKLTLLLPISFTLVVYLTVLTDPWHLLGLKQLRS